MTQDETDRIVGKAVRDLQTNRKTLACLKSLAADTTQEIDHASQLLKSGSGGRIPVEVHHHDDGPVIDHEAHWVTARHINEILEEMEQARKRIAELENVVREAGA